MERLTIPDVIVDENTTRRTIIDASEVRKHAMDFYWRLKKIEDILGDDYDLDRLREMAEADREGRCVPVVRCRECKHYKEHRTKKYGKLICRCTRMGKYDMDYPVKPDDFCSYGERSTD